MTKLSSLASIIPGGPELHHECCGRVGSNTGRRSDVDNAAAFRPESRQSGFDHEERTQHIRVELTVKLLLARLCIMVTCLPGSS